MLRITSALALTAALLAGCADFPDLDSAISPAARTSAFPELLPVDQLVAGSQEGQVIGTANLQARAASLRARAARLQRPVIDRKTRNRMRRAIARHS